MMILLSKIENRVGPDYDARATAGSFKNMKGTFIPYDRSI
jgi:hypothetical protein